MLFTGDFLKVCEEPLDKTLAINLKGFFLTGQGAACQMALSRTPMGLFHRSLV